MVRPEVNTPDSQMPGENADPNSPTNIAKRMMVLQGQAIADSIYDPAVPKPTENFSDYPQRITGLGLVAAALMVGLHMYLCPNRWPKLLFK